MRLSYLHIISLVFILSGYAAFCPQVVPAQEGIPPDTMNEKTMVCKSLIHEGNLARLKAVLAKAERGEEVVVGAIGGSITMGAAATTAADRWANRVAGWFEHSFPDAKVRFYNAGIGATNSTFGALRAHQDLLQYAPDLVLFEFSINDSENEYPEAGAEGLLRQILNADHPPTVIMLAMMNAWGKNVQEYHLPLAQHYDIPFVSFRHLLEPMLNDSILQPGQVLADAVHPNNKGHQLASRLVNLVLEKARARMDSDEPGKAEMPAPLHSDQFEHVSFVRAPDMVFESNDGWSLTEHAATKDHHWRLHGKRLIEKVWNARKKGSKLTFGYTGTFFALTHYLYPAGKSTGRIRVTIDGGKCTTINGTGEQTWGGYQKTTIMGEKLPAGDHRVTIEFLKDEDSMDAGNGFDIVALGYGNQ